MQSIVSNNLRARTTLPCVDIELITSTQNAEKPEYRLYESIIRATKFLLSEALVSRFTIYRWKIEYPIAPQTVIKLPSLEDSSLAWENGFIQNTFETMNSGSNASRTFIVMNGDGFFLYFFGQMPFTMSNCYKLSRTTTNCYVPAETKLLTAEQRFLYLYIWIKPFCEK